MLIKITVTNYRDIHNKISFNLNNSFNIFTCNYDKVEDSIISLIKLFYKILTVGGAIKDSDIKENTCIKYEFKVSENIYTLTIKNLLINFSSTEFYPIYRTNCIDSNIVIWGALNDINLSKSYLNNEEVNSTEGLREQIYHTDYHNYIIKNIMQHLLILEPYNSVIINQLDHVHSALLKTYLPEIVRVSKEKNIILNIFSNSSYLLNTFRLLLKEEKLNKGNIMINHINSSFSIGDTDIYTIADNIILNDDGKLEMIKHGRTYATPKSFIPNIELGLMSKLF